MKKVIVLVILAFLVIQIINGQNNQNFIKKMVKPNYTELDSNYKDSIVNKSIILVAKYKHTVMFFNKLKESAGVYQLEFKGSTVIITYGPSQQDSKNLTMDFEFDSIYDYLIVFNLKSKEKFAYQVLRIENGYLVVNLYHITEKGKLKNARTRLLFMYL